MSKNKKNIERIKSVPKDYTFLEACALLSGLGYEMCNKGDTSGSRVMFVRGELKIMLHRPHPQKEMKHYAVKQLLNELKSSGDIK